MSFLAWCSSVPASLATSRAPDGRKNHAWALAGSFQSRRWPKARSRVRGRQDQFFSRSGEERRKGGWQQPLEGRRTAREMTRGAQARKAKCECAAMPRFFFDYFEDGELFMDTTGMDLADVADARQEAANIASEMARDHFAVGALYDDGRSARPRRCRSRPSMYRWTEPVCSAPLRRAISFAKAVSTAGLTGPRPRRHE